MKQSFTFTISISAIIILISIQAYIIFNYYNLKSKNFDLIYSNGIMDAMESVDDNMANDTLNKEFNNLALQFISDKSNNPTGFHNQKIQNNIKHQFDSLLNRYETNTQTIKNYLHSVGMDTLIHSHYIIKEIFLLRGTVQYSVYKFIQHRYPDKEKGLFINSYYKEGNYYGIRYEYFIDFTKKHRIILAEMKGLLIIVSFTIMATILAFTYTLNAWNKQKKLSELKGDFIDQITHEFKTPLSSVSVAISSLKLRQIQQSPEKYKYTLRTLEKQTWYLTEMIDHVIDVSLLDRKAFLQNKKNINLSQYLHESIQTFLSSTQNSIIQINEKFLLPENFCYALDQVQFSRVINNLLSNSIKYCTQKPVIDITAKIDKQLILEFSDNGIGIKEEFRKEIFNKFYRAENPLKTKGLGLGLYIVKKIIENHQGTIQLVSKPHVGTTITISLPV
jgi:two-component system, OmpR family, phosphate regulon sensor histidine kinase PhoR